MKSIAVLMIVAGAALGGCSSLPNAGPTADDFIEQANKAGQPQFEVIDVDTSVVDVLLSRPRESFHSSFGRDELPPEPRISVGDTVAVSIWEPGGTGLFSSSITLDRGTGARPVTIPDQIVGRDGAISIPFAGRVKVAGGTIAEIQGRIAGLLKGKAVDPQIIVSVPRSVANSVTVSGEVVNGARVPLSPKGERLLDMIAAAGGARATVYDTFVRLSRGGMTATIPLETLIADPAENLYARPGDVLTLVRVQQSFDAFGATGRNAEINFDAERISLSQALAKSAGLEDLRADPAGIFLLRDEPAPLVNQLKHAPVTGYHDGVVPVVYHLDFSDASAFFLAQRFPVRDKDVIYVANAKANQLQKLFALFGTLTNPIVTGVVVQNATR